MARTLILAAIVVIVVACKTSDSRQSNEATPAGEKPAPSQAGEQAEKPAEASRERRVEPAAVQALLDTWLKAQNEQDFATYESLYARRFEGVRRSGSRTIRLDRAGWIADRERMFKKRMSVEMRDVEIEPFATGAALRFTQRWASGKYEDIGSKLIVIVLEEGALRIAREEMLSSQLIAAAARSTELADASFAFVIEADGDHVVLDSASQQPATLELVSEGDPVVVKGKLAASDVPAEVASWKGQKVTDGACVATIVDFAVIGRVIPHFGTRQEWAGGIEEEGSPYTSRQIAEDAFASSETVIAGKLQGEAGCTMGSFVYKQGNKGPASADPVSSPALDRAAIRAFRALSSWKEIQKEFVEDEQNEGAGGQEGEKEGARAGPWDAEGGPTIRAYEHRRTGAILVVVQAQAGEGCGRFFGNLSALFKVKGSLDKPRLELLGEPSLDEVHAVLDIEDDGSFELIVTEGHGGTSVLMSETGDSLRVLSIPFLDCGC